MLVLSLNMPFLFCGYAVKFLARATSLYRSLFCLSSVCKFFLAPDRSKGGHRREPLTFIANEPVRVSPSQPLTLRAN